MHGIAIESREGIVRQIRHPARPAWPATVAMSWMLAGIAEAHAETGGSGHLGCHDGIAEARLCDSPPPAGPGAETQPQTPGATDKPRKVRSDRPRRGGTRGIVGLAGQDDRAAFGER